MSDTFDDSILAKLGVIAGVSKVGGGPVPLPNTQGEMNDHLFINLTLGNALLGEDMVGLVEELREIAFQALNQLGNEPTIVRYATICVSLFTPISATEGLRIYRTRLNTRDLKRLDRNCFKSLVTGEESNKPEFNDFLQAAR